MVKEATTLMGVFGVFNYRLTSSTATSAGNFLDPGECRGSGSADKLDCPDTVRKADPGPPRLLAF